jgi:type II secretory pathway component PulF
VARFAYKARTARAEAVEGIIEAGSENSAVNKLVLSGYFPVRVWEEPLCETGAAGQRIRPKDIAYFTRRLSELLNSGMTLYGASGVVENQTENNNLKIMIRGIRGSIEKGGHFSEALKEYPGAFPELYINIVRSGEESGSIGEVLSGMADFLDKDEDLRSRLIAALAYPCLTAITGIFTIVILTGFIAPRMAGMFADMGGKLPFPTRVLIWTGDFLRAYWIPVMVFAGAAAFLIGGSGSNPAIKNKIDAMRLRMPVLGRLVKENEFMRFSKTLSMLLKNGVPMLNSLAIVSGVVTNSVIRKNIEEIHDDIKAGTGFASSIKKKKDFPVFLADMAAAGEAGGFLDKALSNIARNYEIELERDMKIAIALMEPVFILVMGALVGFIVIAVFLPIFQLSLAVY